MGVETLTREVIASLKLQGGRDPTKLRCSR